MNFRAVRTIWWREVIVHLRDKPSLISSVARSVLWLVVFGSGFGSARFAGLGVDYHLFLFPGVIAMSLIFTSMRSGISVIWDREFGFMKEILVSPASRFSIMMGKVLGGSTIAMFDATIILLLGPFFGTQLTVGTVAASIAVMFIASLSLVGGGLVIASFMKSFEGFQVIMTFIIMPMFFLSGALFPLKDMPPWIGVITRLDPLTYGVDALRTILVGVGENSIEYNLGILLFAGALTIAAGTKAFKHTN